MIRATVRDEEDRLAAGAARVSGRREVTFPLLDDGFALGHLKIVDK